MQLQKINYLTKKHEWMPCPDIPTEYPGLAYICPLDEIIVTEARDRLHDIIGNHTKISYTIFNKQGEKIFVAVRENRWKRFTIKIYNLYGNEVIKVKKLFTFCLNRVDVWAPRDHFAGSIEQVMCNKYSVKNFNGENIINIRTESCRPLEFVYYVRYMCGIEPMGVIKKQAFPEVDINVKTFGVSFPVQLDVRDKAVLLGACFLIGFYKC